MGFGNRDVSNALTEWYLHVIKFLGVSVSVPLFKEMSRTFVFPLKRLSVVQTVRVQDLSVSSSFAIGERIWNVFYSPQYLLTFVSCHLLWNSNVQNWFGLVKNKKEKKKKCDSLKYDNRTMWIFWYIHIMWSNVPLLLIIDMQHQQLNFDSAHQSKLGWID